MPSPNTPGRGPSDVDLNWRRLQGDLRKTPRDFDLAATLLLATFLRRHARDLRLLFLPPYSPQLAPMMPASEESLQRVARMRIHDWIVGVCRSDV
jgi:hypothetical protein